jgi:diguanylate cyclase (GGDEF)-like protein/putative nucleotidyltransferase with HDIG domain
MLHRALRALVDRVASPSAGDVSTTALLGAVRQLWTGLAVVAVLSVTGRLMLGNATILDAVLLTVALSVAAVLRLRDWGPTVPGEVALVVSVAYISVVVLSPAAGVDDHQTGAALLLLTWPLVLAAYFRPLGRALALVLVACVALSVDLFFTGHQMAAVQRIGAVALVFGALAPMVSMVRLRAELSVKYLKEAAIRDPLTGLLNRRGFEAEFAEALHRVEAGGEQLALIVADVDYFKAVNDLHGHAAGDQVLIEVSTVLFLHAPAGAEIARIGGEEFAFIVPGVDLDAACAMAEGLRQVVEDSFGHTATRVTMSLGIVATERHGTVFDQLLQQVDQAMYAAKSLGRNRAVGFSDDVMAILERARIRQEEASRNQLATLLTLAEALDLRDASTAKHSRTVADYAEGMARELGLDADLVERVRLAGLLHDIGKIGVPDSVLLHPGKLDDEQWELMRQHPEIGARMLNHADYADIRDWVLAHHERIDGRGYPAGLAGDRIPLVARILAVADSYEAMTADRVYRASPGHAFARSQLHDCSGTQFDPDVVTAMVRYLDANGIGLEELEADGEDDAGKLAA